MAANASGDGDEIGGINVTPLVDVVLVLLVVVLVTAKTVVSQGVPTDLPKAATAGEVQAVFAITVGADGRVDLAGRKVATGEELRSLARAALADDRELRAVVQASRDVGYGAVLTAVDDLRLAGVTRIAFAAERVDAGAR